MEKKALYFSHDRNARNDEKIVSLKMDLGYEGYGLYWAIVEILSESSEWKLKTNYKRLAYELISNENIVKQVIEDYDLFKIEDEYFYSDSLLKRMILSTERSESARKSAYARWHKFNDAEETECERNANASETECERNAIKNIKNINKEDKLINIEFTEFWDLYDKKISKPKCEKKWNSLKDEERIAIMEYLPKYKEVTPDKAFRKDPITFMNNESWNDELILKNKTNENNRGNNSKPQNFLQTKPERNYYAPIKNK